MIQIFIEYAAAQKPQRFKLGPFYILALHGYRAGALYGAAEAALIDDVVFLRKGLAVYAVEVLKPAFVVVLCGQKPAHLHGAYQPRGTHARQLIAGEGVVPEISEPFLTPLFCGGRVVYRCVVIAADCYGLYVFPAQHGSHAGPTGCPFIAYYGGVPDQVFAGGAYAKLAELYVAATLGRHLFSEQPLTLGDPRAPQVIGVVESHRAVIYLYPGAFFPPARDYQRVYTGTFKMVAEGAAAV